MSPPPGRPNEGSPPPGGKPRSGKGAHTSWLDRLLPGRGTPPALDEAIRATLERWQALPAAELDRPHHESRYVVVNTGATGLTLGRDRLLAVAAIAVDAGLIRPAESFYAELEADPARALADLLAFVGKAPVVVFNAGFNRVILERAFEHHLGMQPGLQWLDLLLLLPALYGRYFDGPARLGDWMQAFGIDTFQHRQALGDAWAIARLFLAVQAGALAQGASTPRGLAELESARRQLPRPA